MSSTGIVASKREKGHTEGGVKDQKKIKEGHRVPWSSHAKTNFKFKKKKKKKNSGLFGPLAHCTVTLAS